MLFDEKRNKILVRVIAIIAITAFAGFGLVAGGLAMGDGCSASPVEQAVADAESVLVDAQHAEDAASKTVLAAPDRAAAVMDLIEAKKDIAKAQANLAQARAALDPNDPEAITAAQAAVTGDPDDFDLVLNLATIATGQNNPSVVLPALAAYTARHPDDAQAFAYWGQLAEQAGQLQQAILAYQRFLELAPDDTIAPDIRTHLNEMVEAQTTTN
ncbi:MAG: hypothetical protein EXQ74_00295 [Thermoleophilia bacterium]|nr:hypothetical protein [Thermoleophilia bacterium]